MVQNYKIQSIRKCVLTHMYVKFLLSIVVEQAIFFAKRF
jgi:hypothetical protein